MYSAGGAPALNVETARKRGPGLLTRLASFLLPDYTSSVKGRSSYLPGLDGLRALSVIAVLIYHARPELLPGGYLGVEVFFVISGFIITRALLNEWRESRRIGLRNFWLRRARRLLPAVGLLLAGVLAYVAAFEPEVMADLRMDALAALGYITNWHLILSDQSYFDSFQRPSMLRHLWSLAVEEQFYILWPLVLAFGLPILRQKGLAVLIIAGIAASAAGMALLYDPAGDNSRAYFGTDTRAAGLLVGALLAFVTAGWQLEAQERIYRWGLALVGAVALSALAIYVYVLDESKPFLYQGGFLAVSLISAVVILAAIHRNPFASLLSLRPLRWVGVRSYGIYLWHWPIYMLTWPREATTSQLAMQLTAIFVISAASYALLEQPIREGLLGRAWQGVRTWPAQTWRFRSSMVLSGAATTAVVAGLIAVAITARPRELPAYFQTDSINIRSAVLGEDTASVLRVPTLMGRVQTTLSALMVDERTCPTDNLAPGGTLIGFASSPFGSTCPKPLALFEKPPAAALQDAQIIIQAPIPTEEELAAVFARIEPERPPLPDEIEAVTPEEPPPVADTAGSASGTQVSGPATEPAVTTTEPPPSAPIASSPPVLSSAPLVTAIGDSVMQGAAYALAGSIPGIDVDTAVGRQASAAIGILQQKAASGLLGNIVVVHIGNNGTFTAEQFDQLMAIIGPDRRVIVLNLHVPRQWEESNNAVIQNGVVRYPNAVLIDWATAGNSYPEILYNDGIHLTPSGAAYYSQLVVAAIGG